MPTASSEKNRGATMHVTHFHDRHFGPGSNIMLYRFPTFRFNVKTSFCSKDDVLFSEKLSNLAPIELPLCNFLNKQVNLTHQNSHILK